MATPITDEKALFSFLKSAIDRGEIRITPLKGACCSNKGYQIDSELFDRHTFGLYIAVRYSAEIDPMEMIIDKMIFMLKNDQISLL